MQEHDAQPGQRGMGGQPGQPGGPWAPSNQPGQGVPPGAMPGWGGEQAAGYPRNAPPVESGWGQPGAAQPGNPVWGQPGQAGGWGQPAPGGWQQAPAPADATWAAPGNTGQPPHGAWGAAGGQQPAPQPAWGAQPQGGTMQAPAPGNWNAAPGAGYTRPAIEVPAQQPGGPWNPQAKPAINRKRTIPVGIFLGAALAVALGAAGAVWAFTRAGSDGASAESARMLPPSTLMYTTMTTDAASRQWVQLSQLLKRLGVDSTAREARDQGVSGGGLNWEEDVAPFLGGQATFAVTGMDGGTPSVVAVLETSDAQKAWDRITKVLNDKSETKPVESGYRGVAIRTYEAGGTEISLARKDRYLLFSNSMPSLKSTLDLEAGSGANLAASDRFKAARAAISGDVLFFTYLDLPEMAKLSSGFAPTGGNEPVDEMLASAGLDKAGLALAASAETTGLKFQWQVVGVDSSKVKVKLPAAGGESKLARRAPDNTLLYLYGNDLYNGLLKAMRQSVEQLRSDPNTAEDFADIQRGWDELTAELGFDLDKELLSHITGEFGVALGARENTSDAPWVLGMGGVNDTAAVGRSLNRITDWSRAQGYKVNTTKVGNTTVTESTIDGEGVSYALVDSDLLLGYGLDTVRRALESKGKLSDNASFQEALKGLPGDRVLTGFLNVQQFITLAGDSEFGGMFDSPATKNLRYLSFAATQQEDRYGGIVFLRIGGE